MKFLAMADIHLKNWNDKAVTSEGLPLKLQECLNVVESGCKLCLEKGVNDIIIAGDLNDTKGIVNVISFALFKELIDKYPHINFHIIPGNHDASMKNSKKWAVDLVRGPENVFIYTEPTVVDDITFIPWSNQDLAENIQEAEPNKVMISHFGLSEGHLSSGISLRTNIRANHLRKFDIVILGHYHCPQQIDNIYYVGSPIPYRRDEVNDIKRYLFVDTDTMEVESIPTEGYRKYVEYIINEESNIEEIAELMSQMKDTGDFIVVKNELANVPNELKDLIEENKNIQLVDRYEEEYNIRGITSGMTIQDQMKQYCIVNNVPEVENDEYIRIGMEYMNSIIEDTEDE